MNVFHILKRRLALFLSACMILSGSGVVALAPVQVSAADKVTPYIAQKPVASSITEGQSLADSTLTGGRAQVSSNDATSVPGYFRWKTPAIKPKTEDKRFSVLFIPSDQERYANVEFKVSISVNKAPGSEQGDGDGDGNGNGGSDGGSTDGGSVSDDSSDISADEESPIKSVTYGGSMVKFSKKNVVSSGSVTITFNSKMTYTGKKIKLPEMGFTINYDEMLPGVVSNPEKYKSADFFGMKYKMKDNLHASVSDDRASDYVSYPYFTFRLKLNSKAMKNAGISASEIKAMKKRLRAMNRILDSRETSFEILPVDLSLPSTSVTATVVFKDGKFKKAKNILVKANCNGQIREFKMNKKGCYISVLDAQKGIISVNGKNDFMGSAVIK